MSTGWNNTQQWNLISCITVLMQSMRRWINKWIMLSDPNYITMFIFIAGGDAHFELCQPRPGQQAVFNVGSSEKHSSWLRLHISMQDVTWSEEAGWDPEWQHPLWCIWESSVSEIGTGKLIFSKSLFCPETCITNIQLFKESFYS